MEVFQIHKIIIQQALALHIQHHTNQVTASNICSVAKHILSRFAHGDLDNKVYITHGSLLIIILRTADIKRLNALFC